MKLWQNVLRFLSNGKLSETVILILAAAYVVAQIVPEPSVTNTDPGSTATPHPSATWTVQPSPRPANTASITPTFTPNWAPNWGLVRDSYFASLPDTLMKAPRAWTVSPDGVKFVSFWEGFYATPYNDGGAVGNCTIGYGHLLHLGECNGSERITYVSQASALTLLESELNHCGSYIPKYVTVPITQNQYNVMASLICNWGYGKFAQSEFLQLLNAGRYVAASERLKTTATCGIGIGCGLPGLVRRRGQEARFFIAPPGVLMWPFVEK